MDVSNHSAPPVSIPSDYRPDLIRPYIKLVTAIVVVVAIILGVYFFVIKNRPASQSGATNPSICICKECGTQIRNTTGLDCEEIQCPNCGHSLSTGTILAATNPMNIGANGGNALTQNQRETLAERGIVSTPMGQNQRETLAEQGVSIPPNPSTPTPINAEPQPIATVRRTAPTGQSNTCVCPRCGTMIANPNGLSCSNIYCPSCRSTMTNAIIIGGQSTRVEPREPMLIGMQQPPNGAHNCPQANTMALQQPSQSVPGNSGAVSTGQPNCPTAPCPMHQSHQAGMHAQPSASMNTAPSYGNTQPITYSNGVSQIINANCIRCHGGPIRNLSTYTNLKAYADNGLLMMMVQPGGPMSRFLSAEDADKIISWVKSGAPP